MLGKKSRRKAKAQAGGPSLALFYIPRMTSEQGLTADDRSGYIFEQVLKRLGEFTNVRMPPELLQGSDKAINVYIRNYGMVLLLVDHEDNRIFYSANYKNKLPTVFTDRVRRDFNVLPDSQILWASDVYVTPRQAPAREVIWGEKLQGPPKETRTQKKEKWQHPEGLSPEELDYLMGKKKQPPTP